MDGSTIHINKNPLDLIESGALHTYRAVSCSNGYFDYRTASVGSRRRFDHGIDQARTIRYPSLKNLACESLNVSCAVRPSPALWIPL